MDLAELIFDARDIVGESLVWHADEKALYWVDIGGKRIHRLEPGSGRHDQWSSPGLVTSIGLRADGGFIVGMRRDVCLWRPDGAFEHFVQVEPDLPDNRLNEGRVAPDGSFWVGTMQDNLHEDGSPKAMDRASGAIYRIDPSGAASQLTPRAYGISNTMCWTDDGKFVFADTTANEIYLFDHDPAACSLSRRRTLVAGFERGLPDGSCLDDRGTLWNCRVAGGAAVANFGLDGALLGTVELAATWPTSCAFGGEDLGTLFIASARFTMGEAHLFANPQEGGLFASRTGAHGRPEPRFG